MFNRHHLATLWVIALPGVLILAGLLAVVSLAAGPIAATRNDTLITPNLQPIRLELQSGTPTPTATPTFTPTATPSEHECVRDANANGIGDVVDIMTTAVELRCLAYLPVVVAAWRQPWPTPSATASPTGTATPTDTPTNTPTTIPAPPGQPFTGPGSSSYAHASYTVTERGVGNDKYWLYQPAVPRPAQAPVVVFLHGWGVLTPDPYLFWLEHLVRKGNIVIYPRYQATLSTPTYTFTDNAIAAVVDALSWLTRAPGQVRPNLTQFAILGHSYGGTITVNMAHRWQAAGLPQPKAIMPVQPGTEPDGAVNIDSLNAIPSTVLMNCHVGADDHSAGREVCDIIWDRTSHIPAANRDYVVMYSDHHGEPGLDADHYAPVGGPGHQEVDALDWYGFWKDFDALRDCAFYGANCAYGVGNTPEHRFMGLWSDGVPVRELLISDVKPPADFFPAVIVLADRPDGLKLVSAPLTLSLTVGQVAYLPVEVLNYRRPITVSAQTLIHTYVNDQTPAEPGASPPFVVGVLNAAQNELKLQTLRMRDHDLVLAFGVGGVDHEDTKEHEARSHEDATSRQFSFVDFVLRVLRESSRLRDPDAPTPLTVTLTLMPAIQPRTPLFGIHSTPFYDGIPEPYTRIWGPQCDYCDPAWPGCAPCPTTPGDPPGTTRDVACGKAHDKWDTCRCRHTRPAYDPAADARTRRQAPEMQRYASQFLRNGAGGWVGNTYRPGDYLWDRLDWLFGLSPQERDYSPLLTDIIQGNGGWLTCPNYPVTNPDGSIGFFDPNNSFLTEQYRLYMRELATRYAPDLRFLETHNEPTYSFYLCPCLDDPAGPGVACNASGGPNQYVCDFMERPYGADSEEFAQVYGPFLSQTANIASEELAAANPDALLVAGALEQSGKDLMTTTRYMIEHGLLERGNVAIMIHQFPYPSPPDWVEHEPCVYSGFYYLPPGCETAPPMEDYTSVVTGQTVSARRKWAKMDLDMDVSEILHDAQESGQAVADLPTEPTAVTGLLTEPTAVAGLLTEPLDRFYLFDTELHAGFYVKDETTTVGRAAIAGLRVAAINAHQRFVGMEFIGAAEDPAAYNLLVQHLAGATPVYTTTAPLMDADYSGMVYKLFTRGQEDIIALWSNAETPLTLTLSANPTRFKQVTLTRFTAPRCADVYCTEARDRLDIASEDLTAPPATVAVQPLYDFYFLAVISDRPSFGWLAGF